MSYHSDQLARDLRRFLAACEAAAEEINRTQWVDMKIDKVPVMLCYDMEMVLCCVCVICIVKDCFPFVTNIHVSY